ncbi:DUF1648 domain-containing protein [Lactiplantibacillus modestisalitolerans]|uniref:DUF1648 domain-containing protein n=1 Tax=Lactiplantibacillus modestisalitolerans TaxID=1457219 RepID=A0ABV5WVL9_9LACO|nr:DUF1648 domain-containing protein [Lactiplantibacillus modestisalitolerans]
MKSKVKSWLSYVVIVLPMIYGLANYQALPSRMAIHFSGTNMQPDGFLSKPLTVFGLPLLMIALQLFLITVTQLNSKHKGAAPRFERVLAWIIPVTAVVTYVLTIAYNLGHHVDIWRITVSLIAVIFIAIGNYLPTISASAYQRLQRGVTVRPEVWRWLKYRLGHLLVGSGLLLLVSIVTVPLVSMVVIGGLVIATLTLTITGLVRRA